MSNPDSETTCPAPKEDGSSNPKQAHGRAKPPVHAIPPSAIIHLGAAMEDGEYKYGLTNWRENPVDALTYYDAANRHFLSWLDGEDYAGDSGVHHLAHVMACCAIILDAELQGTLINNRPVKGKVAQLIETMRQERFKKAQNK